MKLLNEWMIKRHFKFLEETSASPQPGPEMRGEEPIKYTIYTVGHKKGAWGYWV